MTAKPTPAAARATPAAELTIIPLNITTARLFLAGLDRNSPPVKRARFAVGVLYHRRVVGVAICGSPERRRDHDGLTLEVLRIGHDGTEGAREALRATCEAAARALGYQRLIP